MDIAIIADDDKKELMAQFCMAYCGILARHHLCATSITGKYISDATGLEIEQFMTGMGGGGEQIAARIAYNEIDLFFYFRSTEPSMDSDDDSARNLLRLCDIHNVPVATNIATAEALVLALDKGYLDWRELVNPHAVHQKRQ
ncbi:MAG: methylglyoxal synthase [Clostridia bacterium]|nr:methylglyoxal synthase [Clostridia bacterium]